MCAKKWDWGDVGRWEIVFLMNARFKNLHSRINIYYNYYCLFFHLIHIIRLWRMRVRWFFTSCVMNGRKLVLMLWVNVRFWWWKSQICGRLALIGYRVFYMIHSEFYIYADNAHILAFLKYTQKKLFNSYFMTTFSCFSIYKHHNFNGKEKISEKSFVIR